MTTSQWGVPNWRDAAAYGDAGKWSKDRWRWEFLRRREDLREFFDHWKNASHQANHPVNKGLDPESAGFLAFGEGDEKRRCFRDFRYAGVPNPRIGCQPSGAIIPFDRLIYRSRFIDHAKRTTPKRSVLEAVNQTGAKHFELWLEPNEVSVKFDIDAPLKQQVDIALEVLRAKQKHRHGKLVKHVKHQEKWIGYLRTLDAREAKATWREIAAIHSGTAQSSQTGRDKWKQANALRFEL